MDAKKTPDQNLRIKTRIRPGHPDLFILNYRDSEGGFSAQLVIQHHDKVVTNSDIGKLRKFVKFHMV